MPPGCFLTHLDECSSFEPGTGSTTSQSGQEREGRERHVRVLGRMESSPTRRGKYSMEPISSASSSNGDPSRTHSHTVGESDASGLVEEGETRPDDEAEELAECDTGGEDVGEDQEPDKFIINDLGNSWGFANSTSLFLFIPACRPGDFNKFRLNGLTFRRGSFSKGLGTSCAELDTWLKTWDTEQKLWGKRLASIRQLNRGNLMRRATCKHRRAGRPTNQVCGEVFGDWIYFGEISFTRKYAPSR